MPTCDMRHDCAEPVTHLDVSGYVYCAKHGIQRRASHPCRKLRTSELKRLARGEKITRY